MITGKAGPEHTKRRHNSDDSAPEIFLLPGAYPIPKPSYSEPRRASLSYTPTAQHYHLPRNLSLDNTLTHSLDDGNRKTIPAISRSQSEISSTSQLTPDSGLGSSNLGSFKSYHLLDNASLEKSTDDSFVFSVADVGNRKQEVKTEEDTPPPLPTTPIPGTKATSDVITGTKTGNDNSKEHQQTKDNNDKEQPVLPLSGRERLKLIEEELTGTDTEQDLHSQVGSISIAFPYFTYSGFIEKGHKCMHVIFRPQNSL